MRGRLTHLKRMRRFNDTAEVDVGGTITDVAVGGRGVVSSWRCSLFMSGVGAVWEMFLSWPAAESRSARQLVIASASSAGGAVTVRGRVLSSCEVFEFARRRRAPGEHLPTEWRNEKFNDLLFTFKPERLTAVSKESFF